MKTYRGSPTAARNYVEVGRGRADDYYLAEGTGLARRFAAGPDGSVARLASLTGDAYEAWVAGVDPNTGVAKGRLRHDDSAVRFVEVTVNGPKSWSLAAELHPDIAAAYDAAQDRAAEQIIGWLGRHATARVGPRGGQVQVPVTAIEAVTVRHHTSRAGDPHRHLHLQINARVLAAGRWRGLHTVGVRDSLDAINGIGHAAVGTDPQFRTALAAHGFTLNPHGEIDQLAPHVGAFSARAAQIAGNIERYETDWQTTHPGQTPGAGLRQAWDARAWADARPDKVTRAPGRELNSRWLTALAELGYRDQDSPVTLDPTPVGSLDRDASVEQVIARLSARRSRWNAADIRGEVEQLLARHNIVTDPAVRLELAEDLTARTVARCRPVLERVGVPEHIRALTSEHALQVEADLGARLAARGATESVEPAPVSRTATGDVVHGLDEGQVGAARLLAGRHDLVVIEGAAGAGKTTTLAAARDLLAGQDRRLMVVTPTLKAAKVAAAELGSHAGSAAWLAFHHGYRWDEHGAWTRLEPGQTDPHNGAVYRGPGAGARLRAGDLLLVDEAGMLDQDTARALLTIADEQHVRVALMGDRHQLAAVGRGGVLDLAARHVDPDAHVTLDRVHRFTRTAQAPDGTLETVTDVEYADLSLAMRSGENPAAVFDALAARGQLRVHGSDDDRVAALAELAAATVLTGERTVVVADTRDQVALLNTASRARLVTAGHVDDRAATTAAGGQRIGVGDQVTTRHNDANLDVANRDIWTVTHVNPDGSVGVTGHLPTGNPHSGDSNSRHLPAGYVAEHVELAYASTVHGVQGDTAHAAHLALGEHTGAASAYVGMTRGRTGNIAHLVATDLDDARAQWVAAFSRDRSDLGPAHAAQLAAAEAANYAQPRPLDEVLVELRTAWTAEQDALDQIVRLEPRAALLGEIAAVRHHQDTTLAAFAHAHHDARDTAAQAAATLHAAEAVVVRDADRLRDALLRDWDDQRPAATVAARTINAGTGWFGTRRAAVNAARATLQDWAATWRPYVPTLPTDPDALTHVAGWADNRPELWDCFDRWACTRSEQLHPEHQQAQAAADQARAAATSAGATHRDATRDSATVLWRYGNAGHTPNPAARAAELDHQLDNARAQLTGASSSIATLTRDPALLSRPADRVTNERARWQHERVNAAAATRPREVADAARRDAAQDYLKYQSVSPQPDRGPGFGR